MREELRGRLRILSLLVALAPCITTATVWAAECPTDSSTPCYFSFEPPGAMGAFHYFASQPAGPIAAVIGVHGHPRDALKTFAAVQKAAAGSDAAATTLIVAPVFQVPVSDAAECRSADTPESREGDLLWTCASWLEGAPALNGSHVTSFAALDALIVQLLSRWPSLQVVTIAGFSAGAQMVQHYVGFAGGAPDAVKVRYVIADPGTWLYFDRVRPQPMKEGHRVDWSRCEGGAEFLGSCTLQFTDDSGDCPDRNHWKYGTEGLPATLGRTGADARARYSQADIGYLEGELDSGSGPGTFYRILDKSCSAKAQGPYRMQRGLAYAAYDRALLARGKERQVVVVPGCAHDVACVFPSEAARSVLLGAEK
jgi:hypothetical protein